MTRKEMHEIRMDLMLHDEDEKLDLEDWIDDLGFAKRQLRDLVFHIRWMEENKSKIEKVLKDYYGASEPYRFKEIPRGYVG